MAAADGSGAACLQKLCWCVELRNTPSIKHHDTVVVGDGVQPMRDGQHRALPEGGADGALDERIRRRVDLLVCRRQLQDWKRDKDISARSPLDVKLGIGLIWGQGWDRGRMWFGGFQRSRLGSRFRVWVRVQGNGKPDTTA